MNPIAHRLRCFTAIAIALLPGLLAAAPLAWITNNGSNNMHVIDTATDMISGGPISLPPLPHAVAVSSSKIFVAHESDTLSIIDKATRNVTITSLMSSTLAGVASSPDGSRVYVSARGTNQLFVINTTNNNVITTLPVSNPIGIAVKPDGSRAYVAYDDGFNARIAVLDTGTNTLLPSFNIGTGDPSGVAVTPDGTHLYVSLGGSDKVVAIDLSTHSIIANIGVGTDPRGIVVNHAGTRVYVAEHGTHQVAVIDTATNHVIDHFTSGGNAPWGIDVSADDSRVYVVNHGSGNVGIRNVTNNTMTTRIVGSSPIAFGRFIDTFIPPEAPPVLANVPDQSGIAGSAFSLDLGNYVTTTNGDAILSYQIDSGVLPDGLNLNAASGLISGTPMLAGRGASITVTVSDDDGESNSDTITFTIAPPTGTSPFDVMVGGYNASVSGFSQALNGNVAPSRLLSGANTQLLHPMAMAYESEHGELFVGDTDFSSNNAVRVYAADASGNEAPIRVLDTRFDRRPYAIAVDALHDELVVVGSSCWPCTWSRTANGAAATLRSLTWGGNSPTQGNNPASVALDPANDLIFIGDLDFNNSATPNAGKVLVFPRLANGGASPARVIKGPTTRIGLYSPYVAFDPSTRQLFVLTADRDPNGLNPTQARIVVFNADDDGNVAPLRSIEGAATKLVMPATEFPFGLSFDASTQRLVVSIYSNSTASNRILAFYAGDRGNVAPLIEIGGSNTGFDKIGRAVVVPVNRLFRDGFE